jgi:hypothetical protein
MSLLDDVIARLSIIEHDRDAWKQRAEKAETDLQSFLASPRPTTFSEGAIAERIAVLEQRAVTAALRQEVVGLWARFAVLEAKLREATRPATP